MTHLLIEAEILLADPAEEAGLPTATLRSELRRLGTTFIAPCCNPKRARIGEIDDSGCGHNYVDGGGCSDPDNNLASGDGSGTGEGLNHHGHGGGFGYSDGDGHGDGSCKDDVGDGHGGGGLDGTSAFRG